MRAKRLAFAVGWGCIALLGAGRMAGGQEKPVVDQLLDILRQNKMISDQQYQELKQKAEQERKWAPVAPPSPSPSPVVAGAPPASPAPVPAPPGDTLRAYFKNGFNLETADGRFKFAPIVLTQLDWNVSDPGSAVNKKFKLGGTSTGVEFRRARLGFQGVVFGNIDYKFEYDFAEQTGGQPSFKDVYMGMSQIPWVQYIRVGHFKEPYSLDELTPDTYTTFMERGLPNAFAQPGTTQFSNGNSGSDRQTGVAVYQNYFDQHMAVMTGGFRLSDNFGNGFGTDSPYDFNARISGVPLYDVGNTLLHLGFSYAYKFRHFDPQNPNQNTISFANRPEAHLFPVNLVNTTTIPTNGVNLLDPEVAFVLGPFAAQGEYMWALVDQAPFVCAGSPLTCKPTVTRPSNPSFGGGYIEASYFLTGESRSSFYKTQYGWFDRVIPIHNFWIDGSGWGAWQVAVRYSYLDLDSARVHGGALDDITGGINWYLNPVSRITVNYVWAHLQSVGDSNIVEGRFQLAW
jgi:phosphate-selective porin OprO/OprP